MEFLKGKSSRELKRIAKAAIKLAEQLNKEKPSYDLAIANGCYDKSYGTTANGEIASYGGEAIVTMENGRRWRCVGHSSTGDAYYGYDGYIEFIPLD
jgi:hypothetical protein